MFLKNSEGVVIGTTPMLVPSFSSRANIDIRKILTHIGPHIKGPILISAYDMHYVKGFPLVEFPTLIFIDSGGYECAKGNEISELGFYKADANDWSRESHLEIVASLDKRPPPKVIVSYDHPSEPQIIENQIKTAKELFQKTDGFLKEILIKPEPESATRSKAKIDLEQVIRNLRQLTRFDILGFTEKELGSSVLERMVSIAIIREEMDRLKINIPIHIFGSLDTITTPLYYLSGADIFDGLAWLRFILSTKGTLYLDSYGPRECGIEVPTDSIWIQYLIRNISYLNRLSINLEKFQSTGDFSHLGEESDFFKDSLEDLKVRIGGDNNGQ
jgi:hypothetical protein